MSGSTKYLKAVEELAAEHGCTVERSKHLKIYDAGGRLIEVVGITPKSVDATLVSLRRKLERRTNGGRS